MTLGAKNELPSWRSTHTLLKENEVCSGDSEIPHELVRDPTRKLENHKLIRVRSWNQSMQYLGNFLSNSATHRGCYLRPVSGCTSGGWVTACGARICLGVETLVFDLANSRRIVWGRSGSNLTPCCKTREREGKTRWELVGELGGVVWCARQQLLTVPRGERNLKKWREIKITACGQKSQKMSHPGFLDFVDFKVNLLVKIL